MQLMRRLAGPDIFWYYHARRVLALLLGVALAVSAAAIRAVWPTASLATSIAIARAPELQPPGDQIRILFNGRDYEYLGKGRRTWKQGRGDAEMLVTVIPSRNEVSLLSIPRDTYAYVKGMGYTKVNAASAVGGAKAQREVLEALLGVPIHFYVDIGPGLVRDLVNALGGVVVDVEKDMCYDDRAGGLHIHLKKGRQRLDGTQAEGYLRFRHDPEGDFGRIRRQRAFMAALSRQVRSASTVTKVPCLYGAFRGNTRTDLSEAQLFVLARWVALGMRVTRQETLPTIPFERGGVSYLRVDWSWSTRDAPRSAAGGGGLAGRVPRSRDAAAPAQVEAARAR